MTYSSLDYLNGVHCLSFEAPIDTAWDALSTTDFEPSGDFWASLVEYLCPDQARQVELDPEANAFYATGDERVLSAIRDVLEPLFIDADALRATVERGTREGHDFDEWGDY